MSFKRLFLLMLVAIIGFSTIIACGPDGPELSSESDGDGNLLVVNESNARLVLYDGETPIKIVPNSLSDFIVNVDMGTRDVVDLKLFKYADVQDDVENPADDKLFKRWVVPLPNDTKSTSRSTWTVFPSEANPDGSTDSKEQGTIIFDYAAGSTYDGNAVNVEIFLNNVTGARIATLKPGDKRNVAVDLGLHKIVYRYWYSNQQTTEARDFLGVRETNADGDIIYAVLAADEKKIDLIVPPYDAEKVKEAVYSATVTIHNDESEPIRIWAGSQLISDYLDTGTGTEFINANSSRSYVFSIEAAEGETAETASKSITLKASGATTTATIQEHIFELKADERWDWRVRQDPIKQESE